MKRTNRLSIIRLIYELIIGVIFIAGNFVLWYFSSLLIDQVICLVAINICFFLLFILSLIKNRLQDKLPESSYITYGKIAFSFLLSFAVIILCARFAPDYFAPVLLIPLILSPVLDQGSNLCLSVYFVLLLAISQNFGIYLLICYLLLVIFGGEISDFIKDKNPLKNIYSYIIILCINTLISIVFYYFSFLEISFQKLINALVASVITVLAGAVYVSLMNRIVESSQTDIYDLILNPDYELCQEIHKFSYIEYQHAVRVSNLARACAREIKADERLCACGGFYYRLGKLEGEPMIDNAIKIANNHCFPDDLITLISEYGGIIALPSTKESAIVHMVDTVVTKVELFDSDSMSSSWNQNMVIYQTINELSQKGLYDESGLSMNQFLMIREKLANEDILA